MQDRPDLGQAHPHALAGHDDPAPPKMLVRVDPMAGVRPVGHHDAFVLPVPEDVSRDSQLAGCLTDLHESIMTP